jgi:cell division protein FtsI (penicillin-binding protein 3)/stage V sporulation protein D (sporulation-specific penicillin-binding protein)
MALSPSFNPNRYGEEEDVAVYKNSFVEDVFEMGSIMKPITMAAALDAGALTKDTTYFDQGFVELDKKRIENFDGKSRGRVDMQEVLSQSLNTGAVFAALALGKDAFREYMYKFGFQDKTDIDLPGEVANLVANLESNKSIEIATASFGQGIAVTPLAMTRALAALGNGGFLIKPRLVKSIERELGYSDELKITEQGRAISGKTSEEITRMLVHVVDEALLGGEIKMEHYSIAAKTGTAQIASPEGGYYDDRYLHSFFGYFPAYEPKFLVFMFLREPVGVKYASETLARPFRDIAEFLLNYYEVPPDR